MDELRSIELEIEAVEGNSRKYQDYQKVLGMDSI